MSRLHSLQHRIDSLAKRLDTLHQDPCNEFHAVRQFLHMTGIDTRVLTYGSVPCPKRKGTHNVEALATADNSFFFELRTDIQVTNTKKNRVEKRNTLAILGRVFFPQEQDAPSFTVQLVANHRGDAIYPLAGIYETLHKTATDNKWTHENAQNRIPYYEMTYTDRTEFELFIANLMADLEADGVTGALTSSA